MRQVAVQTRGLCVAGGESLLERDAGYVLQHRGRGAPQRGYRAEQCIARTGRCYYCHQLHHIGLRPDRIEVTLEQRQGGCVVCCVCTGLFDDSYTRWQLSGIEVPMVRSALQSLCSAGNIYQLKKF